MGSAHKSIGRRSEDAVAVLYRRTSDQQKQIISTKGNEVTTYEDQSKRALEIGLQQATECNERLWLHNRRMFDALYHVHESMKAKHEKPDWMSRVVAALEDKEP
jgi:hypothetical protein